MSLRKPYELSPVRLAAKRRSARQSTGPRSARGQAQSRLNRLRYGSRSRFYQDLRCTLMAAPPRRSGPDNAEDHDSRTGPAPVVCGVGAGFLPGRGGGGADPARIEGEAEPAKRLFLCV